MSNRHGYLNHSLIRREISSSWKLRDFGLFGVFLSAILIASDLYACSLLKILIDMSASLKVSARLHKNLLHCNRFSESGRFSFSRIGRKSGVKIHVRFALRHCRADRSARQIVVCKPAYRSTEISPLSSEAKVRNLIAEIRVVSLISANFVCISFAQYCKSIELLIR